MDLLGANNCGEYPNGSPHSSQLTRSQSGISALVSVILQRETYEPVLLERRTQRARIQTNNPNLRHPHSTDLTQKQIFTRAIVRPVKLLFKSPIVFMASVYVSLAYGYTYLLFTSFGSLFADIYGFSQSTVGLTFLGIGIGSTIGLVTFGALSDKLCLRLSQRGSGGWKPEHRLPPLLPGSLIVPLGLLWYGWSAQAKVHWIMPIIGSGWVGLGTIAIFMPVQTYLVDAFPLYAASAAAANTILRSLAGAFLPLAGPKMYETLGQGWGNSLLAFIALVFTPLAWIMLKYGERFRTSFPVSL